MAEPPPEFRGRNGGLTKWFFAAGRRAVCSGDGRRHRGALEDELAVLRVDPDRVALGELTLEEPLRERVLDEALQRPLERTRAVRRIPAGLREHLLRR